MAPFREKFDQKRPVPPARTERGDAPELVRKLLLDLMEERADWDEEFDPYEFLCDALGQIPEDLWGEDRRNATRYLITRKLPWPDVYELIERVAPEQERRVNEILAQAGVGFEYWGGEFHLYEPEADELEVSAVEDEALAPSLDAEGKFTAPKRQYAKALELVRTMPIDTANAVAQAVNALEGTVAVITEKKNIADGLKQLYQGERAPLSKSMEMLFVYGSTKDGVRHGARKDDDEISVQEATYVVRSAGSAIAYLIAAYYEGSLNP